MVWDEKLPKSEIITFGWLGWPGWPGWLAGLAGLASLAGQLDISDLDGVG